MVQVKSSTNTAVFHLVNDARGPWCSLLPASPRKPCRCKLRTRGTSATEVATTALWPNKDTEVPHYACGDRVRFQCSWSPQLAEGALIYLTPALTARRRNVHIDEKPSPCNGNGNVKKRGKSSSNHVASMRNPVSPKYCGNGLLPPSWHLWGILHRSDRSNLSNWSIQWSNRSNQSV